MFNEENNDNIQMDIVREKFLENLAALLRSRKMSKRKLSLDSGQKETAVRDIFNGNTFLPRVDYAVKMAAVLQCGVEELLGIPPLKTVGNIIVPHEDLLRECVNLVVACPDIPDEQESIAVADLYEWSLSHTALGSKPKRDDIRREMMIRVRKMQKSA